MTSDPGDDDEQRRPYLESLERGKRLLRYLRPRDYDVGYGKPPMEHRFKPGQSGNPKGRPPGVKGRTFAITGPGLNDTIMSELGREVGVQDKGGFARLPVMTVIIRRLAQKAIDGHVRASETLLNLLAMAERDRQRSQRDLVEAVLTYQQEARQELRRREREGESNTRPVLPHPDDIEVHPISGAIVLHGPASEEEAAVFEEAATELGSLLEQLKLTQSMLDRDSDDGPLPDDQRAILLSGRKRLMAQIAQFEAVLEGRDVRSIDDEGSS